jgi:hypothetical protein
VRNDARIMNKLHRRVFLDKIDVHDVKIYISFYVEASNRDAFMAVRQVRARVRRTQRQCAHGRARKAWRCAGGRARAARGGAAHRVLPSRTV